MKCRALVDRLTIRNTAPIIAGVALMATSCSTGTAGTPVAGSDQGVSMSSAEDSSPPTSIPETAATDSTATDSTTDTPTSASTPASTRKTSTESVAPEPARDVTLKFGGTYTWADGLSLSVGAPTSYIPADDQKDKGRAFVSMSFALTNRSRQAYLYDAGSSTLEIVSGGDRGVGIADLALPERSPITVVPGQSISWRQAYGVKTAKGITVKVALTGDEPPVTFSSDATATKGTQSPAGDVARFDPFIGIQKFGGTYTFARGLKVTATGPKNYVPGEDARAPKAKRYVQYDITVVNGTRETFEPTALSYGMSENAEQVGSVIDRAHQIDALPKGRIPPGSKYTLKVAFGVAGTGGRVLDIRIRENPPVVFTDVTVPEYTATEPGGADPPAGPGTGGTSTAPSTTQEPKTDQVDERIAVKGPVEVSIDGTIAWKNGVTASISTPKRFTPSNDRRRPVGAQAVKATLTVTNGSPEPLTSYAMIEASSKNRPAPSLIDPRADVGGFDLAVEPGKKTTIQVAWYALDPSDMVIMLRPDIAYDPGYLSSTGPQKTDAYQPSPAATGRADVALKFGSKFTYQNGVSISVTIAPADRVGSVVGDDKSFFAVSATVTNNSHEIVPFSWSPDVSSGNASGDRFTDERKGIGMDGLRDLLPGRTITQVVGVSLTDTSEITVASRDPDYRGPSLLWSK